MASELTDYGFIWGQMEVTRLVEIDGGRELGVKAGGHKLTVYVSPTGRSVRVWKNGKELK